MNVQHYTVEDERQWVLLIYNIYLVAVHTAMSVRRVQARENIFENRNLNLKMEKIVLYVPEEIHWAAALVFLL